MGIREEWESRHNASNIVAFTSDKPTIDELERLLNSDDEIDLTILPNGQIVAATGKQAATGQLRPLTFREKLGGEYSSNPPSPASPFAWIGGRGEG